MKVNSGFAEHKQQYQHIQLKVIDGSLKSVNINKAKFYNI